MKKRFAKHAKKQEGEQKEKGVLRGLFEWLVMLAAAAAIALVLRTYVLSFYRVQGPSMQPTLYTGERLLVNKIGYRIGKIRRFDVVVCHYPDSDDYYVKRVIAMPGDAICIKEGTVCVNDRALDEAYVVNRDMGNMPKKIVPDGSYMVFGDNRADSYDSRSIGAIKEEAIVGRAVAVTWPVDKIKALSRVDDPVSKTKE